MVGCGITLLMLELVFRLLPVSTSTATGYYNDPLILTYPSHHRWTVSTGWDLRNAQALQANAQGFVSDRDYVPNPDAVALIGDSFVEASMLPADDRPGPQLQRALEKRPVYAMGGPGSALLDYAERIRYAHERFGVRDFVLFLETGDVRQSLCGSGNVHGSCLDRKTLAPRNETIPEAAWAKRIARHSALAQYLFSQLKLDPRRAWRRLVDRTPTVGAVQVAVGSSEDGAVTTAVANAFFQRVRPFATGRLVLVLDSHRKALYEGRQQEDPGREQFIRIARAAGAIVVDTEPLFQAHIAASPLTLDVSPSDAHLNPLGIGLAMRAAAVAIARP